MRANLIIYDGRVLIDLTGDTVEPETLLEGVTGHDAAGNPITGKMKKTVYRSVTKTLQNCTIDNAKTSVIDGQGYAATLTASAGYTMDGAEVSVTMGGVDVSGSYSNGRIGIPEVTGDLNITAKAAAGYVNLFDKSKVRINKRYNSSQALADGNGHFMTNLIPCPVPEDPIIIRIKGLSASEVVKAVFFPASVSSVDSGSIGMYGSNSLINITTESNGVLAIRHGYNASGSKLSNYSQAAQVAFNIYLGSTALTESDIPDLIITVNEEIP